jgi:hypothetical protein
MVTLFLKRYERFQNKIANSSINKYFGINDTNINITVNKKNNEEILYLNIFYLKHQEKINFKIIPNELNDLIHSYLNEYVTIQTDILFPSDYPFIPPIWSLLKVSSNFDFKDLLHNISEYAVTCHNNQTTRDWSPATDIEKDILDFIRKINTFEYVFEYLS